MQAIYIMWLRQIKRYFRTKSRVIGSLGQPVLFLLVFSMGFGPIFARAGEGNYIDYLAPGIIGQSILFLSVFFGIEIIWDRQFGFLKEVLVAPVSRLKIMIGRTVGGATIAMIQGLMVLMLAMLVGFRIENALQLPLALVFMLLISLLFTAFGTAMASMLTDMHAFQLVMNFVIMPTFFLSGALFPLKGIPKTLGVIVRLNPLTYGIDGLRASLGGVASFGLPMDLAVLSATTGLILILGAYLFSKIQV
jgi:ABC-2 type transport system permease protein